LSEAIDGKLRSCVAYQFHRQVAYQLLLWVLDPFRLSRGIVPDLIPSSWTIVHTTAHYVNFINVSRFSRHGKKQLVDVLSSQVERTQVRKEAAWQIHVRIRPGDGVSNLQLTLAWCAPVYSSRRNYRPCHAPHHVLNVHNRPRKDQKAVLRGFLVRAPAPARNDDNSSLHLLLGTPIIWLSFS
jgi:hypothetical protein